MVLEIFRMGLTYKYLLIFLAAIAEGPVLMTFSGFLLKVGYASFWPLYVVLMAGDLTADILWYGVGYYYAHPFVKRFGHFFGVNEALLAKTQAAFARHQKTILFLSKITMGFGFALVVLITAGMVRVPLRKYILFNALGQFVWTGLLLSVGYFFGNLYLRIDEGLRVMSVFAFVLIVFALLSGINRYLRTRNFRDLV